MAEQAADQNEILHLALRALDIQPASSEPLYQHLVDEVARLIEKDFHSLLNILYRMDVSEEKIRSGLLQGAGLDAAELIAQLIMDRQAEKLRTRHRFKEDANQFREHTNIPDEDKW